jgi:hypothetical protein
VNIAKILLMLVEDTDTLDLNGNYRFAPNGTAFWNSQTINPVPSSLTFRQTALSLINDTNTPLDGIWELFVYDLNIGQTGSFTRWSFDVTPVPFEFSPAFGLGFLGMAFAIKKKLVKKEK